MTSRRVAWLGTALVVAGIALIGAGAFVPPVVGGSARPGWAATGMMGGGWAGPASAPGLGQAGFVAGTQANPRVMQIVATPQLHFVPDVVTIQAGETITFEVTSMGPVAHEFMVGPAPDVAADKAGTPEIAGLGMMRTGSLTYTFTGPGPFSFACHAPGHFEAGMSGTIVVQ
jgi:uncharacterized cupredoxin-like copper-binding protein